MKERKRGTNEAEKGRTTVFRALATPRRRELGVVERTEVWVVGAKSMGVFRALFAVDLRKRASKEAKDGKRRESKKEWKRVLRMKAKKRA